MSTRHLGVTIESRHSVGAEPLHGALLLDSLIDLEKYAGASAAPFTRSTKRNGFGIVMLR
jgi:hypothetical protein